jgi:TldD protein
MISRVEDLIKRLKSSCDYIDIRLEERDGFSVSLRDGKLDNAGKSLSVGGCVRVCHNGGWGFSSFNKISDIERYAAQAVAQAKAVGNGKTRLAEVAPVIADFSTEILDDPRNHSIDEKIQILRSYDDVMKGVEGISNRTAMYGEAFLKKSFFSSEGSAIVQNLMDISFAASPTAIKDGLTQSGGIGGGSSNDFSVILGKHVELESEAKIAVELLSAPKVKAGVYTVIVDPKLAGVFVHEAFGHTSEADAAAENPQLAEVMKMGAVFGSSILNIYDSGLDCGCRGFLRYDDEGVPAERTQLIKDGQLVGRLHSRETAAMLGEKPTGNARALNYRFSPIPRMRNTCIEGGKTTFEEMLSGVNEGIYVVKAHGGCGGEDFSFSARYGVMIRNGKLCEKVRNVKLAGNLWSTMKDIDAVGDDFVIDDGPGGCGKGPQFPLPVSHSAPHIRIQNISVGGDAE